MKRQLRKLASAFLAFSIVTAALPSAIVAAEEIDAAQYDYRLSFDDGLANSGTGGEVAMGAGSAEFVQDGDRGTVIRLNQSNYITFGEGDPVNYGQSFSFAFWVNKQSGSGDPMAFGNRNWGSGNFPGFGVVAKNINSNLYLNATSNETGATGEGMTSEGANRIKDGDGSDIKLAEVPTNSWVHIAAVFDFDEQKITVYTNGEKTNEASGSFHTGFATGLPTLLGQGYKDNAGTLYNGNFTILVDDFILTQGTMAADEIEGLVKWQEPEPPPAVQGDVLEVDFTTGSYDDATGRQVSVIGTPVLEENESMGVTTAYLNESSAYRYKMEAADYDSLLQGFTIESTFCYNSIGTGEKDILSSQQSGGFGLGINSGSLTFWMNGGDLNSGMQLRAKKWYHVAGTMAPGENGYNLTLYVYDQNGLINTFTKTNTSVKLTPNTPNAYYMFVGGDTDGNGNLQFPADCSVSLARVYSEVLSAQQLAENAAANFSSFTDLNAGVGADLTIAFEGPSSVAANATFTLNLHDLAKEHGNVTKLAYDLVYDPALFEFVGRADGGGGTIAETQPGVVHFEQTRSSLNTGVTTQYATNRHARIVLRTKSVDVATNATIAVENLDLGLSEELPVNCAVSGNEIVILPPGSLDYNGDGVISIGDVAAAPAEQKQTVADAIEGIYPYKRAMILTLDGAGTPFNPDWIYYSTGSNQDSRVASRGDENFSRRNNPYLLNLLQTEWAVSHTAQAVGECHSGENYTSILHGQDWHALPSAYRANNTSTGAQYWPDHAKDEPQYPSVFQVLSMERPDRAYASFSEWTNIPNGIIEPYAPVGSVRYSSSAPRSFAGLTEYVEDGSFKNTTLIFLQDDKMDGVGHNSSYGFNSDEFWREFSNYDAYYENLINALKKQGLYEDTFIITNSDHGGNKTNHDHKNTNNALGKVIDWEVFIAMGGQTVNPGAVLQGGTNADISGIVLDALRIEQPASFAGGVFDEKTFLSQEGLRIKNRDVERVSFEAGQRAAIVVLDNSKAPERTIVAADMVVELNGRTVTEVETEGTILRRAVENGILTLTILFEEQPESLVTLLYSEGAGTPVMQEIMLADEAGGEIYTDLENTVAEAVDTAALERAIEDAWKAVDSDLYENDGAMASLRTLLAEAEDLVAAPTTQEAVQRMIGRISEAVGALTLIPGELEKDALQQAIAKGEMLLLDIAAGKYLPSGAQRLEDALRAARNAMLNATEQAQIDAALSELTAAMKALVPAPDKAALQSLIAQAKALKAQDYIAAGYASLKAALNAAEDTSANPEATQEQVDAALKTLEDAIKALVKKVRFAVMEGSTLEYTGGKDLVIRVDADIEDFQNAYLNGRLLNRGTEYTIEKGSTVFTLPSSLLLGYENGEYEFYADFTSGFASAMVTIKIQSPSGGNGGGAGSGSGNTASGSGSATVAKTGDGAGMVLYICFIVAALAFVVVFAAMRLRRGKRKS